MIKLNIIQAGETVKVEVPIQAIKKDRVDNGLLGKDTVVKFVATYVDQNGNAKEVEKELINHMNWTENANIVANQTLTKYIPFETPTEKGLILQTSVTSGFENNILPIRQTEILAKVSPIAGKMPSKVFVEAKTLAATTGSKIETKLPEASYQYDAKANQLKILVQNTPQEDGSVAWEKTGNDEYIITYIFLGEEVYEATKTTITENFETVLNLMALDGNTRTTKIDGTIDLQEGLGQVVDFTNKTEEITLSKGYVYANLLNSENKIETEYTQVLSANTSYINLVDGLELKQSADTYVDEKGNTYNALDIYNKKVLVPGENFLNMLGEEGWIQICDEAGNELCTITKEFGEKQKDEQGNYYIDVASLEMDHFVFKTSKPVQEGKLEIRIQKAIKGETQYKRNQLEVVKSIKTELIGNANLGTAVVTNTTTDSSINFTEPVTKAEIAMDKEVLSTAVVNENVGITVTLKTDSVENALFKNPTLMIKMPDYVEQINIKDIHLVYGEDQLAIKGYQYDAKTKILTVQLEGTQTKYSIGAISQGAVLKMTTDITVSQLTANQMSKVELHYTNENSNVFEQADTDGMGYAETIINVIAPTGLVTVNGIEGYSEQEVGVQSISSGEEQVGTLSIYTGIKRAKVSGKIVNNLGNAAKNVAILGRTPFKGNKTIDTNKDLGTNIDTRMMKKITLEGAEADIYYSENGEATKDLANKENGWTLEPQDLGKVKSYLIVLKGDLTVGTLLNFYYDVEIPADLPYESNAYTTYKVYYNNDTKVGEIPQTSLATTTGVTTQEGPVLETNLTMSSATNGTVSQGEIVKVYATVKNTGKKTAENVTGKIALPNYVDYTTLDICNGFYDEPSQRELNINFGTIPVGESRIFQAYLRMGKPTAGLKDLGVSEEEATGTEGEGLELTEEQIKQIENGTFVRDGALTINVTAKDVAESSNKTINFKLKNGTIKMELISSLADKTIVTGGQSLTYLLKIYNLTDETLRDVTTEIALPDYLEFVDASRKVTTTAEGIVESKEGITYDANAKKIIIKTTELATQQQSINLELKVKNEYEGKINLYATTTAKEQRNNSNLEELVAEKTSVEVSDLTTSKRYVKEKEEFTYQLTVRNTSNKAITATITDELPNELQIVEVTSNGTKVAGSTANNKIRVNLALAVGETRTVIIKVIPKLLTEVGDKQISNKATISGTGLATRETNTVTNTIEYVEALHENKNPGGNNNRPAENRYKITGTAWLDENGDGKRDEGEKTLAGVRAILLNKSNYSVVQDTATRKEKITTTSDNGKYEFANLPNGEYIVAFIYDAGIYTLTTYHKEGVEDGYNSDAIAMNITFENETHNGAATDNIRVAGDNVRDIDIGLVRTDKFDLRLDKYITKISVTSSEGNRTYNYNNANFTKIELPAKAINGATVVVEYKIVVKNEGGVAGYAKKIIDYIPNDMKFSSNLNSDWYLGQDGNVYNTTLENVELQPGESKELTIVLTKKLTDNNLGQVTNCAEIYEAYNARGISDVDSTPGNNVQTEDDFSTASVTITIVTGKVASFFGITFASIAIIALGAFGIKKYVIKKV